MKMITIKAMMAICFACVFNVNFTSFGLDSVCGQYSYSLLDGSSVTCSLCQPGYRVLHHCNRTHPTVCVPCGSNTFNTACSRSTSCADCAESCESLYGLVPTATCSTVNDLICDCPNRMFRRGKYDRCTEHTVCKLGSGVSKNGTNVSDTECEQCKHGFYSDVPQNYESPCRPWSTCPDGYVMKFPGNASHDVTCQKNSSGVATTTTTTTTTTDDGSVRGTSVKTELEVVPVVAVVSLVVIVVLVVIVCQWNRKRKAKKQANSNVSDDGHTLVKVLVEKQNGFERTNAQCMAPTTGAGDNNRKDIAAPIIHLKDRSTFDNDEDYSTYCAKCCADYLEKYVIGDSAPAFLRELGLKDAQVETLREDNPRDLREFLHQGILQLAQEYPHRFLPTVLIDAARSVTNKSDQKMEFIRYLAQVFEVD